MSAEILKFPRAVSPLHKTLSEQETRRERRIRERQEVPAATETGRNHRMRLQRRAEWWKAEAATRLWRQLFELIGAVDFAMSRGVTEAAQYCREDRFVYVKRWRKALMQQLLMPAPDAGAIAWKLRTFAAGQHEHTDTKPERIERAIAADRAWLDAHPVRQSRPKASS